MTALIFARNAFGGGKLLAGEEGLGIDFTMGSLAAFGLTETGYRQWSRHHLPQCCYLPTQWKRLSLGPMARAQ